MKSWFNLIIASATIAALTEPSAYAVEICGNNQDDDDNGQTDEGCAPGLTTGVCESPLSCSEIGWVSPRMGGLHYQLPPDVAPKVPYGPGIGFRRFYASQYRPSTVAAYQASGPAVSGTGAVSPSWPAHQANDVALLIVETSGTQPASLSSAQGFVGVTGSPQGDNVDINGTVLTVYWKRASSSSEPSPTVADSGDHTLAVIVTFRNVSTTGNPWDVIAGDATSGTASSTFAIPGGTTTVDNALVVSLISTAIFDAKVTSSSVTNGDLVALTTQLSPVTYSGNDGRLAIITGTKLFAGTYGTTTGSLGASARQARMSIALRPITNTPVWQRPLGERWQHTYMTWLTKTGSAPLSSLVLHTSRGQDMRATYASAASGWETYTPQTGYHFQYIRQRQASPNEFEVKMLTGETLVYNSSGRLTEVWDTLATPNKVTVAYDGNGQVSTVTDASTKRRLLFGYTSNQLTTVGFQVKVSGVFTTYHTTSYAYSSGNLSTVTIGGQLAQTNAYTSNYLTQIQDGSGKSIIAFDYNATPSQVARIDARSGVLGYEYNSARAACSGKTVLYFNLGNATSCNVDGDCGSGFLCGGKTGSGSTGKCFRGARCLTVSSPSEDVITTVAALGPPSESCEGSCLEASSYVWNTGSGVLDLGAIQDPSGNYTVRAFNANGLPETISFGDPDTNPSNGNGARQMFITYDSSMPGRVATTRRQTSIPYSGVACAASSGECAQTQYTYTNGTLTSVTNSGTALSATNIQTPYSYTTGYSYDSLGRLTQIDGPLSGSNDISTFTYYGASGTLDDNFLDEYKRKKDASNYLTQRAHSYDFWGNPTRFLAPDNTYTCLSFDSARGYLKKTTESMAGQSDCSTNAADIVAEWERDSALRLTKMIRPDGSCLLYEYDSKGRLLRTKRRDDCNAGSSGEKQEFVYDSEGLVTEIQTYDASNTLTAKQPFTYYDSRRLARVVNPVDTSKWTGFTYESRGLVSQIDAPNGLGKTIFNRTGTPGQEGRVSSVDKYKTSSTFDSWNLLFAWLGGQLQVTDGDSLATNTLNDDLGRVVRLTSVDMDAPRLRVYDAASRLTTVIDAYGISAKRTHAFTFDNIGRPLTDDFATDGSEGTCAGSTNPPEIERVYDAPPVTCPIAGGCNRTGGRLAYVRVRLMCNTALTPDQSLDQETFYSYDDAGRVIREYIRDDAGRIATHQYSWTKNGALAGMVTPSGTTLEWTYGSGGSNSDTDLVTAQSWNGTGNPIANAIQFFPYGPLKQYNQQSTLSSVATRTRIARNLAYRPTGVYTETQTGGTTLQSTVLTEDAKGRVTSRDYTPNTLGVEDSYFIYDAQDRLLCETTANVGSCPSTGAGIKNSHTASPPFTNAGVWKENRYSIASTAHTRIYNAGLPLSNHRVRTVTETSLGIGSTNFSFDARGFRYLEDNDSLSYDSRSHVFDQRGNRYSTVGYYRIGATWHSYSVVDTFDSLNRRVSKTVFVNGVTSVYFYYYDALGRVSEVQFTPNTSSSATYQVFQFHWLDDKLVAYSQTDYPSATVSKRYVVTDDTNRPIEMWNWPSSGNTTRVWAINPSEYGLDTNVLGSSYYQPVLFPGQMIDAETTAYRDDGTTVHRPALVLNGNRTYDAFTGSHLQVSLSPSEIETNYTYARTNPPATSGRPEMGSSELVIGPDGNFFDCDSTTSTSVHIKGVGEVISINTTCRQLTHWNSGGDGGGGSFCGRFWYSPPCPTGGGNGNPPPEPEDDDPGQWHPYRDNTGFKNYQCLNAPCQFSCRNGGVYTTLVTTKYHWTSNGAISEAKKLCKDQATFVCGPSGGFGWLDSDKQFCDDRAEMRDFEMTE